MRKTCLPILFGLLHGYKICMEGRHGLKKFLGIYEEAVTKKTIELSEGAATCIDIGCHIGYLSLAMVKGMRGKGKLVCIDPVKENIKFLENTLKANKVEDYKCLPIGIGDVNKVVGAGVYTDSGMARFDNSEFVHTVTPHTHLSFEVKTLDTVCKDLSLKKVDFIKIDVEGYELNVLKGAKKTINKFKPKLLIEVHSSNIAKELIPYLKGLDYRVVNFEGKLLKSIPDKIFHLVALPN